MSRGLKKNEQVYVSLVRLGIDRQTESAFLRTRILADVQPGQRSVTVDLISEGQTATIATSAVHRNIGVAIYAIGDISSEHSLIDPLRKSVLHYLRLVLPADALRARSVRSLAELRECWSNHDHGGVSHVILIGHGSDRGLTFAVDGEVSAAEVGRTFRVEGHVATTFISLCCRTGFAGFAKNCCAGFGNCVYIAPFHSVHGAIASQFVQTYLGHHFLDGKSFKVAFNKAQEDIPSGVQFRLWQNGLLQ